MQGDIAAQMPVSERKGSSGSVLLCACQTLAAANVQGSRPRVLIRRVHARLEAET